jgi:hypothetical protein
VLIIYVMSNTGNKSMKGSNSIQLRTANSPNAIVLRNALSQKSTIPLQMRLLPSLIMPYSNWNNPSIKNNFFHFFRALRISPLVFRCLSMVIPLSWLNTKIKKKGNLSVTCGKPDLHNPIKFYKMRRLLPWEEYSIKFQQSLDKVGLQLLLKNKNTKQS